MTGRVLLAIDDHDLATEVGALLGEGGELEVIGTVATAPAVVAACEQTDVDVVLLHEDVGPLPLLHLTRDLGSRFPGLGVVLLVEDPSSDLLRGALQAGARGVASMPLALDALEADLTAAASWSRSMRSRFGSDERTATGSSAGSRMWVVAGAKGGVGTTTVALHLALEAAERLSPSRSVCLVDLDLQAGDVVSYLDLEHRRSIIDLLEVSEDLSSRHLDEALFRHPSGLHLLLAPAEGENGEDVTAAPTRQILGALRGRFDVVVVDTGAVVTEAGAVAVELADTALVVTTPDVPAMRGANRLLQLWERIDARGQDVRVLVNRSSRISDVQPDLVDSVVDAERVPVVVPAAYRELQAAVNSGAPDRAEQSVVREAVRELGAHLGMWEHAPSGAGPRRLFGFGEAGQGAVEFIGALPFLLLAVALAFQLVLVGMTALFAGHAASAAAGHVAVQGWSGAEAAAAEAVPARWAGSLHLAPGGTSTTPAVRATIRVPLVVPIGDPDIRIDSSSGYVDETRSAP